MVDGQISIGEYLAAGTFADVVSAVDVIQAMVSKAWDLVLSNLLTTVSVAVGLLSLGIGTLVYLRRVARH